MRKDFVPQNFVDSEDDRKKKYSEYGRKKNRLKFLKDNKDNICWNTVMDDTGEEKDFLDRQVKLLNNPSNETSENLISQWYDNFKFKSSNLFSGYEIKTGDEEQTRINENHTILVNNYNTWVTGTDKLGFSGLEKNMILGFDNHKKYGVNYLIEYLRETTKKESKKKYPTESGDRVDMTRLINKEHPIQYACAAGLYQYVIMFRLLGERIDSHKTLMYAIHGDSPECIVALLENKSLGNTLESAFKTTVRHNKLKNFARAWDAQNTDAKAARANRASSDTGYVLARLKQLVLAVIGWEIQLIGTSMGAFWFLLEMIRNRWLTSPESMIPNAEIKAAKKYLTENFHQEGVWSIRGPDWGLKNYYIILQLLTMYENTPFHKQRNFQTLNTTQTAPAASAAAPAGGASRRHRVRRNNTHKIRPNKTRKASRPSRNKTRKAK